MKPRPGIARIGTARRSDLDEGRTTAGCGHGKTRYLWVFMSLMCCFFFFLGMLLDINQWLFNGYSCLFFPTFSCF